MGVYEGHFRKLERWHFRHRSVSPISTIAFSGMPMARALFAAR
jgi:hypothetical protein